MTPAATGQVLLLVDADGERRQRRQFALESAHGFRVVACGTVREARDQLASLPALDGVIAQATLEEQDAIGLLQRIPHEPTDAPAVMVLARPDEQGLRRLAWTEHAAAVLTEPVDDSELAAALRSILTSRERRRQAVTRQKELAASVDHLADVLVLVLDAAVPGSAHRGAELLNLVRSLADRFDMDDPQIDDLVRAARLHEVGRITLGAEAQPGPARWPTGRCTMATARLLRQVPALESVADLIEHVGANWDGSGIPAGVQRGQIPLRSRLLRVGIDLLAAVERNALTGDPSLASAAAELRPHADRWYDPAVIAALNAIVASEHPPEWQEGIQLVSYDRLSVGMRLADDLNTLSGVKLVSAGTVLTATTLQLIRRRHELDPLALPVAIQRRWS